MSTGQLTVPAAHRERSRSGAPETARGRTAPLGWLAVPALVFFVAFAVIPLAGVLILSFTNWDGIGAITPAGIANWLNVFADPGMYHALWLTFVVMIVSWLIQTPISLLLGVFTAGSQKYR